ncbi:hypothetical protein HMI56_006161 [Coelomomyces lativittatus]|nr:hypothetical protein HMI56_006161 [Coelomomyces lativittatus]
MTMTMNSTTTPTPCLTSSTVSSTFAHLLSPGTLFLIVPWVFFIFEFHFHFLPPTPMSLYNPNYLDDPNLKTG